MPKFDVIDNALDFLHSAGEKLVAFEAGGQAREMKYALLHLAAGTALLLKQSLANEHWALVFKDVSKASVTAYETGDFVSPGLDECIERVRNLCGIGISPSHEKSLVALRKLRNKIEHFRFEVSREEGLSVAAKAWSFALDFVQDNLARDFGQGQSKSWEALRALMLKVEHFVAQRSNEIAVSVKAKEGAGHTVVDCPLCLNRALFLGYDERGCLFCRFDGDVDQVFDAWMSSFYGYEWTDPKERMISDPAEHCPSCGGQYYVRMPGEGGATPPDPAFVCFRCGYGEEPTVECTECGSDFTPDDWEGYPWVCEKCRAEQEAGHEEPPGSADSASS